VFEAEAVFTFTTKEAEANLVKMTNNAKGIQAEGEAKAVAEKLLQLATVAAQIDLAKEIGENKGYQEYLLNKQTIEKDQAVELKKMEALQSVGEAQATNLKNANFKIMANSVESGLSKFSDLFSAKGGFNMGTILEGLEQTEIGSKLVDKFLGGKDARNEKNKDE
jgi:flotillin